MNQYTKLFHESNFPGYQFTGENIETNFWNRHDIPIVEIPNIISTEKSYAEIKEKHKELFAALDSQINRKQAAETQNRDWYFTPHSEGWEQCLVLGKNLETISLLPEPENINNAVFYEPTLHQELLVDVRKQMDALGISLKRLQVLALNPGGYVQPHQDPKKIEVPRLSYFWIPLHDSSSSLKIWPMGYVNHRAGSIYLFNNNTWVHSVVNRDQEIRYVMSGLINVDKCSNDFVHLAVKSAKAQWNSQPS